jgi:hypothetical protein
MDIDKNENTCAHPGCNCAPVKGEKYCSPHCETAPNEVMCGCGHVECEAGASYKGRPQTA